MGLLLYLGTRCHRDACVRAKFTNKILYKREAGPVGGREDTSSWRKPGPVPAAGHTKVWL